MQWAMLGMDFLQVLLAGIEAAAHEKDPVKAAAKGLQAAGTVLENTTTASTASSSVSTSE